MKKNNSNIELTNVNYPVRILDFNKFKNLTEKTFLNDDELNMLGTLYEKDLSLADLEYLLCLFIINKYKVKYTLYKYPRGVYEFKEIKLQNGLFTMSLINKIKKEVNTSICNLKSYNLIIINAYNTAVNNNCIFEITELGEKVICEYLKTEKPTLLIKQLIDKVK